MNNKSEILYSFAKGHSLPLSTVNDEVFASLTLGKGVAIKPRDNILYSPCDGKITTIADTCHALGIKSKKGAEILLHIGIDTVNLRGMFFDTHLVKGKTVKKGDRLIEFNREKIAYEGYDTTICMAICNSADYEIAEFTENSDVNPGDSIAVLG